MVSSFTHISVQLNWKIAQNAERYSKWQADKFMHENIQIAHVWDFLDVAFYFNILKCQIIFGEHLELETIIVKQSELFLEKV